MKNIFLIIPILLYHVSTFAQNEKFSSDENWKKVINTEGITFYGMNWDGFQYVNASKVENEKEKETIKKKLYVVSTRTFEKYNSEYLGKKFKKNVVDQSRMTMVRLDNMDIEEIIHWESKKIEIKYIIETIEDYGIEEKEGIGYICFVNYFDEKEKKVRTTHVFFDIRTGEILIDSSHIIISWGNTFIRKVQDGVMSSFTYFISDIFKPKYKEFK